MMRVLIPGQCFGDSDWKAELKGFPHSRKIGRAEWAMLGAKPFGPEDLVMATPESGPKLHGSFPDEAEPTKSVWGRWAGTFLLRATARKIWIEQLYTNNSREMTMKM